MKKQKLLITIGDSWTEGYGCYDYSYFPYGENIHSPELDEKIKNKTLERFHTFGWPLRLGKKMGYDEVWNFGKGGSSTSGDVKFFTQYIRQIDLTPYKPLIVWYVPFAERFSFYANGRVTDYQMNFHSENIEKLDEKLAHAYLQTILDDINKNLVLEQLFYINTFIDFCTLEDIPMVYDVQNDGYPHDVFKNIKHNVFPQKGMLRLQHINHLLERNKDYAHCYHPNEHGYEKIANSLYDAINTQYPHLVGENPNSKCKNKHIQRVKNITLDGYTSTDPSPIWTTY